MCLGRFEFGRGIEEPIGEAPSHGEDVFALLDEFWCVAGVVVFGYEVVWGFKDGKFDSWD